MDFQKRPEICSIKIFSKLYIPEEESAWKEKLCQEFQ